MMTEQLHTAIREQFGEDAVVYSAGEIKLIPSGRFLTAAEVAAVTPTDQERRVAAVTTERDRRIYSSMTYTGASLTATFQTDQSSMESISGAATLAGFALGAGAQPGDYFWHGGTTPFSWITMDNSVIQIDAPTMFHIGQAVAGWKTKHIFAARGIKAMNPIPLDYADDHYWPIR